jgi:hypothetical protein
MFLTNNVVFLLFKLTVDVSYRMSQAINDGLMCMAIYMAQTEVYE